MFWNFYQGWLLDTVMKNWQDPSFTLARWGCLNRNWFSGSPDCNPWLSLESAENFYTQFALTSHQTAACTRNAPRTLNMTQSQQRREICQVKRNISSGLGDGESFATGQSLKCLLNHYLIVECSLLAVSRKMNAIGLFNIPFFSNLKCKPWFKQKIVTQFQR